MKYDIPDKEEIYFLDGLHNSVEIELDKEGGHLAIWSAPMYGVFLTENQAKNLVHVLNYWVANKKLPPGELNFDKKAPSSPLSHD